MTDEQDKVVERGAQILAEKDGMDWVHMEEKHRIEWAPISTRPWWRQQAETAYAALRPGDVLPGGENMVAPVEPTNMQITRGHADGVRADLIWADIDEKLALRLQQKYLPAAYRAMLAAAQGGSQEEDSDGHG